MFTKIKFSIDHFDRVEEITEKMIFFGFKKQIIHVFVHFSIGKKNIFENVDLF